MGKPSFSLRLIECTAASERIRRLPIAVDDKLCITLKEIINMTHSALAFAVGRGRIGDAIALTSLCWYTIHLFI